MTIPIQDLALAYELRSEGLPWKLIAYGLGHDANKLADEVHYRKTKKPSRTLSLQNTCDVCGKHRGSGSHAKCSRIRQRATMHTQTTEQQK